MAVFLTVHARYKDVQLGLFRGENLIDEASDESKKISKNFILLLDHLLSKNKLSFPDLSFIAAHQGPAPFTTLRVTIASVNGFAFATGVPLIGINGLEALIEERKDTETVTVVLLNAFCQELYYAIAEPSVPIQYGYENADKLIHELAHRFTKVRFLGNGSEMYRHEIETLYGDRATILPIDLVSLQTVAKNAMKSWLEKKTHTQLMPVYLKGYSTKT